MKKEITVADFSASLFWDIDKTKLDFEKNKRFVIERTLTHELPMLYTETVEPGTLGLLKRLMGDEALRK